MKRDRSFWIRKFVWTIVAPILTIVVAKAISLRNLDRPLKTTAPLESEVVGDSVAPREDGTRVDYRALFEARQDAETLPARENGWRDILAALGPRALTSDRFAESVPWSEMGTNEETREWFATKWSPLCDSFELDPNEEPTFRRRLDLRAHLAKYGTSGREPNPTASRAPGLATYWEDGALKTGRVSDAAIQASLARLESNPWTEAQFPTAAAWLRENEDLREVARRAVRAPKFGSRRSLSEEPSSVETTDLSDLQGIFFLKSLFATSANYRIGSGDVAGAIDDIESILATASFFLRSKTRLLNDRLVALGLVETAAGIGIFANQSSRPTSEEARRLREAWNRRLPLREFEGYFSLARASLRDVSILVGAQNVCEYRRETGNSAALLAKLTDSEEWKEAAREAEKRSWTKKSFLFKSPFDEEHLMDSLLELFERQERALASGEEFETPSIEELLKRPGAKARRLETNLALDFFASSQKGLGAARERFSRAFRLAQTRAIVGALWEYQLERGSLPPATLVDSRDRALHSWRVLILPYLGEEEGALFEKFDLNEPWNSERNEPLQKEAPLAYRPSFSSSEDPSASVFFVPLGQDCLLAYGGVARDLVKERARRGALANSQALLFERRVPICWTRPDSELDAHSCRETFGKPDGVVALRPPGGTIVGLASGAARCPAVDPKDPSAKVGEIAELLLAGRE